MTEIKQPPQGDNEKIIEQLKNENASLRKKLKVLQIENASLRKKLASREEKPPVDIEEKKPLKLFKKEKKKELSDSIEGQEEPIASKVENFEITSEFDPPSVPLSTKYKTIMEGDSRRMCPSCDNTRHQLIYEETDKTHILMDYPRIYGKCYKCGNCGTIWRVPTSLD
ncbi:MAG: hypothetical protein KGD65_12015 [Candidatus Lokiarchaeota archaeon]|nr:hypothetical protein [Candidatus Lokiarchaeota archaeon]